MYLKINLVSILFALCFHLVAHKRAVHLRADGVSDSVMREVFLHAVMFRGLWTP